VFCTFFTHAQVGIPSPYRISALVTDPVRSDVLYLGTFNGGVFKSTDGGAKWTVLNEGLSSFVRTLVINPQAPEILYAGTLGGVFSIEQQSDLSSCYAFGYQSNLTKAKGPPGTLKALRVSLVNQWLTS